MVRLKINNIEFPAEEGETILDAAKKGGIAIPVLCHKDGLEHYTSCMVCMVKENSSGRFIPSCSALVQEGMDIDASGEEVLTIRKKAVEMLLSEHRAECEAPCRIVCPAGYNIPLLNRYLAIEDFDNAIKLTASEIDTGEIICSDCPGYCENACRRKKIDLPVSIRDIKIFISASITRDNNFLAIRAQSEDNNSKSRHDTKILKEPKRFSSHIGKNG
jgi:ferredoxin